MNKALLIVLLTVCILGMALIMLNERLHGEYATAQVPKLNEQVTSVPLTAVAPSGSAAVESERALSLGAKETVDARTAEFSREVRGEASLTRRIDGENSQKKREEPTRPVREERPTVDVRPIARTEQDSRKSEKEAVARRAERREQAARQERADRGDDAKANKKADADKNVADKKTDVRKSLKNFVVFVREKGATVRLNGNSLLQFKTSQMHKPERVLIELDGEWDVPIPKIPRNDMVAQVRVSRQNNKTRVVLDLKAAPRSCRFIQKSKQNLDVRVDS